MTIPVHRHGDGRICGHTTVVTGQSTVYANNKLIAVNGDPNTGGGGAIAAGSKNVYINNKLISNDGDGASPDGACPIAPHCSPSTSGGSPNVFVPN
jgi:uncharacterized Zn-binding protein involved in type VI secretion